ncbi:hypothetical protein HAZT_HAZT002254, partial [Hyalella azteca]
MVHELMKVYGLLELMKTVPSSPASEDYVKLFHSSDYINFLKAVTHTNDDDLSIEEEELEDTFGLGDGVENAFAFSRSVLTVSLHLKEDGFFPGTGTQDDVGEGEGRYFCLNVPYKAGLSDDNFVELLK